MRVEGQVTTEAETLPVPEVDLTELFINLSEEHRNVFITTIGQQLFIYRSLGRKEYSDILENPDLTDFSREEVICDVCTLYPRNFNFKKCSAGTPTILRKKILKDSLLDSLEARRNILIYYRSEMYTLENQITCIINEAFPNLDIEEIEAWDIEKTMKYLTRAEWKLQNLRGVPCADYLDMLVDEDAVSDEAGTDAMPENSTTVSKKKSEPAKKGVPLTTEQKQELARLKAKYPEIDWDKESVLTGNIRKEGVDDVAPALRTPK